MYFSPIRCWLDNAYVNLEGTRVDLLLIGLFNRQSKRPSFDWTKSSFKTPFCVVPNNRLATTPFVIFGSFYWSVLKPFITYYAAIGKWVKGGRWPCEKVFPWLSYAKQRQGPIDRPEIENKEEEEEDRNWKIKIGLPTEELSRHSCVDISFLFVTTQSA